MDRETKIKVAERAKELLQAGWIKGEFITDQNGDICSVDSIDAAKFCLLGGFRRAYFEITGFRGYDSIGAFQYREELKNCIPPHYVEEDDMAYWNDLKSRRKKDVIKLVDCILAQLKGECDE